MLLHAEAEATKRQIVLAGVIVASLAFVITLVGAFFMTFSYLSSTQAGQWCVSLLFLGTFLGL